METLIDYSGYLIDISDVLYQNNELFNLMLEKLIQIKVYNEWLLGLNIAIFAIAVVLIFAVFISKYK